MTTATTADTLYASGEIRPSLVIIEFSANRRQFAARVPCQGIGARSDRLDGRPRYVAKMQEDPSYREQSSATVRAQAPGLGLRSRSGQHVVSRRFPCPETQLVRVTVARCSTRGAEWHVPSGFSGMPAC